MADAKYPLANKAMQQMAYVFVQQLKLELEAKRTRRSVRAKWKKVGKGWEPTSVQYKKFRGNYVASGELVKSIKPMGGGLFWEVRMEKYGEAIRKGRKPGKGIPIQSMKDWIATKKIKPRDIGSGQFSKNTAQAKETMSFLFNRKIKHFGIDKFDFVSIAKKSTIQSENRKVSQAFKQDIYNYLFKNLKPKK